MFSSTTVITSTQADKLRQQRELEETASRTLGRLGGQEVFDAMVNYAQQNWSQERKTAFSDRFYSEDERVVHAAIEELRQEYVADLGTRTSKQIF